MNKYEKGKIYKIIDDSNNNIYIGSTVQKYISTRLQGHISSYKRYLKGFGGYTRSFDIIKNNNYHIELIESYPCKNSISLRLREAYWVKQLNCVNNNIPARTDEEKKEYNKIRSEEYREKNGEKLRIKNKLYYKNNKEKERIRKQLYRKNNPNVDKLYYKNNKDKERIRKELYREKKPNFNKLYRIKNNDKLNEYDRKRYHFKNTWCGVYNKHNTQNNLLWIDVTLFE